MQILPEESHQRSDHEDNTGIPDRNFQTAPGTPEQTSNAELENQHNLQSSTTPSRITINIREPSSAAATNSHTSSSTEMQTPSGGTTELEPQNQLSEPMEDSHRRSSPQPDSPCSSSSVEIEEVTAADDIDMDPVQDIMVDGMDDDTDVNDMLDKFPYADQQDGYQSAANLYLSHVEGNSKLSDSHFADKQLTSFRQH